MLHPLRSAANAQEAELIARALAQGRRLEPARRLRVCANGRPRHCDVGRHPTTRYYLLWPGRAEEPLERVCPECLAQAYPPLLYQEGRQLPLEERAERILAGELELL